MYIMPFMDRDFKALGTFGIQGDLRESTPVR